MSPARIVLSTASLYTMDVARCFELAAEAGFDGMEVMCDDRWSTRDPHYLTELSARYGIPILVLHTPFSGRVPGWPKGLDQFQLTQRTLELAETLGAESIVVHLPSRLGLAFLQLPQRTVFLPWPLDFRAARNWFERELPRIQRRTSVKLAIENLPARRRLGRELDVAWRNTVPEWSRVHEWLTLDTTHWATKRISPQDAYAAARGRVCHVHLSNYDGREHRLPHQGWMNLGALLQTMAADHFSGTISIEVYPDALAFDDAAALRRNLRDCLHFCRQNLGQPVAPQWPVAQSNPR